MFKVAVIGAGISGAVCAVSLARNGLDVTVFEKGREYGGRTASRTRDENQFDYGAQYFTVRTAEFEMIVTDWLAKGWVKQWDGKFWKCSHQIMSAYSPQNARYVAVPSMNLLARNMLKDLVVNLSSQVTRLKRDDQTRHWSIAGRVNSNGNNSSAVSEFEFNDFDAVALSLPPAQANALAPNTQVAEIRFDPCWSVMLTFPISLPVQIDGVTIDGSSLSWIARDSSKPDRPSGERWILHGAPGWSANNLEAPEAEIIEKLLNEFFSIVAVSKVVPTFSKAHRWRYARASTYLAEDCLFDEMSKLGYCGDWCAGDRIESAYQSGIALATRILSVAHSR